MLHVLVDTGAAASTSSAANHSIHEIRHKANIIASVETPGSVDRNATNIEVEAQLFHSSRGLDAASSIRRSIANHPYHAGTSSLSNQDTSQAFCSAAKPSSGLSASAGHCNARRARAYVPVRAVV